MLLSELYSEEGEEVNASDIDLSEFDKKLMINILNGDTDDGVNVKDLYTYEHNSSNLRSSLDDMKKYGFVEEQPQYNFYKITDIGLDSMRRASLVDDSDELIMSNAEEYIYTDAENMSA